MNAGNPHSISLVVHNGIFAVCDDLATGVSLKPPLPLRHKIMLIVVEYAVILK